MLVEAAPGSVRSSLRSTVRGTVAHADCRSMGAVSGAVAHATCRCRSFATGRKLLVSQLCRCTEVVKSNGLFGCAAVPDIHKSGPAASVSVTPRDVMRLSAGLGDFPLVKSEWFHAVVKNMRLFLENIEKYLC